MKIFPLTIYLLLFKFIQILPSDSKKSFWEYRTTATLIATTTSTVTTVTAESSKKFQKSPKINSKKVQKVHILDNSDSTPAHCVIVVL
jgi:hypothetical protein